MPTNTDTVGSRPSPQTVSNDAVVVPKADPQVKTKRPSYQSQSAAFAAHTAGDGFAAATPAPLTPLPTPVAYAGTLSRFSDTAGDVYQQEIEQAANMGLISGFTDGSFRPNVAVTREQLVSIMLEAIEHSLGALPAMSNSRSFADVPSSRWSARKIALAKAMGLVSGYPGGTFRPTQVVTRGEMMAMLRKASDYLFRNAVPAPNSITPYRFFDDVAGHWAQSAISYLSTLNRCASAYNENGNSFYPDSAAKRNYAAAAVVRMVNGIQQI